MANVLAGEVLRFVVKGRALGQAVENTWWYQGIAFAPPAGVSRDTPYYLDLFIALYRNEILPNLLDIFTVDYYQCGIVTRCREIAGNIVVDYSDVAQVDGVLADTGGEVTVDVMPLFNAIAARKRCADINKFFRSSNRFGPINESWSTNGELAPAILAAWTTDLEDFRLIDLGAGAPVDLIFLSLCLFSPTSVARAAVAPPVTGMATYARECTEYVPRSRVTSQVSRKIRRHGG